MLMKDISIPLSEISSIDLGSVYSIHVKIETSGGKKFEFPLRFDRREKLRDAIYQAKQAANNQKQGQ